MSQRGACPGKTKLPLAGRPHRASFLTSSLRVASSSLCRFFTFPAGPRQRPIRRPSAPCRASIPSALRNKHRTPFFSNLTPTLLSSLICSSARLLVGACPPVFLRFTPGTDDLYFRFHSFLPLFPFTNTTSPPAACFHFPPSLFFESASTVTPHTYNPHTSTSDLHPTGLKSHGLRDHTSAFIPCKHVAFHALRSTPGFVGARSLR
jgi:hypothetical protein